MFKSLMPGALTLLAVLQFGTPAVAEQEHPLRAFTVTADQCAFSPAQIGVDLGDRVRVTFIAADAPHSFVIDQYRVAMRATPGRSVTFDFLANTPGTFPYVSNLASDAGCPNMRGDLVVRRPER